LQGIIQPLQAAMSEDLVTAFSRPEDLPFGIVSVNGHPTKLRAVTRKLEHDFRIAHTTIQVEVGGCEPNDMFCVMKVAGGAAGKAAHDHGSHDSDDPSVSP
jgi:hypothetical protein